MSDIQRTGDWRADSESYTRAMKELADQERAIDMAYGGLVDLDLAYELIERRLQLAVVLVRHPDGRDRAEKDALARKTAVEAVLRLERLVTANVSLDQRTVVRDDPRMDRIHNLLSELVFFGGASLFESHPDPRAAERLVRIAAAALRKHSSRERLNASRDPDLEETTGTEQVADAGRSAAGGATADELEVEPGEEELIFSDFMVLPISQAVLLVRDEIIPGLNARLAADPGNAELQHRLRHLERQADILEQTRFFPRARPIEIEPGLLTAAIVGFTPGGEALVRMRMPIISSTGNRLDRIRELVEAEILRDVVGSGVSPEVDREFRHAMSPASGRRGSSDDPFSATLRTDELFRTLSTRYPFLKRLHDREEMARLVDLAEHSGDRAVRAYLKSASQTDRSFLTGSSSGALGADDEPPADQG